MKITKSQLKQIIKEELGIMESEYEGIPYDDPYETEEREARRGTSFLDAQTAKEQRVHLAAVKRIKEALIALEDEGPDDEDFAWALEQVAAHWGEDDPQGY